MFVTTNVSVNRREAFDAVMAMADPPVYIVTLAVGQERAGCLVGFATQVSIDPARFMVGMSRRNHTYRIAAHARRLAVHLLAVDQMRLAALFGAETGDEVDKFDRVRWRVGPEGVPVLLESPAWFYGPVLGRYDLGDHVGFVLEPEDGVAPVETGKVVRLGAVSHLRPGHPA